MEGLLSAKESQLKRSEDEVGDLKVKLLDVEKRSEEEIEDLKVKLLDVEKTNKVSLSVLMKF